MSDIDQLSDEELYGMVVNAINLLKSEKKSNLIAELAVAILNGRLDTDELLFDLMEEAVRFCLLNCATEMRYSRQSKIFWKQAGKKFGSACNRYFSGWKLSGTVLMGSTQDKYLDPSQADMIFAVPDEKVLKAFDPYDGDWPCKID